MASLTQMNLRSAPLARAPAARPVARRTATVARAHQQEQPAQNLGAVACATALALTMGLTADVQPASADIAGLTPCSESKAYNKLERKELKVLDKRLKKYEPGSAPYLALQATKERTENRFKTYAKQGLLCGNDGLPHLISDPGLALRFNHAGEVFIPTFGFLYVAGYIGHVGRQYIILSKEDAKPTDKEIILDVPLALKLAFQGWAWPLASIQELRNGSLLEKDENITVSPR
ncbi:photosystem I protein P21 [Dunaliella salina]|uniref:Photosystem I reaction center subunit III n=1 Tax=Dunaliella salina TaxID=3046 RepID=A0ABQ7G8K3_DUNSA|nr:photosystem I protein P21 [Dunaliella salina]|eukprot:KAF5830939.1 photosystem I protein P21 [Dunaliella salina]